MKGSDIHRGWEKGAIIHRRGGGLVKLMTDGVYVSCGEYSLWHFRAVWENGYEETIIPEVGDMVVKDSVPLG